MGVIKKTIALLTQSTKKKVTKNKSILTKALVQNGHPLGFFLYQFSVEYKDLSDDGPCIYTDYDKIIMNSSRLVNEDWSGSIIQMLIVREGLRIMLKQGFRTEKRNPLLWGLACELELHKVFSAETTILSHLSGKGKGEGLRFIYANYPTWEDFSATEIKLVDKDTAETIYDKLLEYCKKIISQRSTESKGKGTGSSIIKPRTLAELADIKFTLEYAKAVLSFSEEIQMFLSLRLALGVIGTKTIFAPKLTLTTQQANYVDLAYRKAVKESSHVLGGKKDATIKSVDKILARSQLCSILLGYMSQWLGGVEAAYGSKTVKRTYATRNYVSKKLPGRLKRKKQIYELPFVVDESSSMNDFEIKRVVDGVSDILRKNLIHVKKLRLLTHDDGFSEMMITDKLENYKRSRGGGTSHVGVIEHLASLVKKKVKLSGAIFLTDGESDIQHCDLKSIQKLNKLWLVTNKSNAELLKKVNNIGHVVDVSKFCVV